MSYEKMLRDIISPMVENENALMIRAMPTANDDEIVLLVLAESNDIARLIGRGGAMANTLRELMNVAGKLEDKHIKIKFESYEDSKEEE